MRAVSNAACVRDYISNGKVLAQDSNCLRMDLQCMQGIPAYVITSVFSYQHYLLSVLEC